MRAARYLPGGAHFSMLRGGSISMNAPASFRAAAGIFSALLLETPSLTGAENLGIICVTNVPKPGAREAFGMTETGPRLWQMEPAPPKTPVDMNNQKGIIL